MKKRANDPSISAGDVQKLLDYDPQTGIFHWKPRPAYSRGNQIFNGKFSGKIAGSFDAHGYIVIRWGRGEYCVRAHRLAWLYIYDEWPNGDLDHIDRVRKNNAIANLRVATQSQNNANSSIRKNNKSGFKGVYRHKLSGRWTAQININGKRKSLGYFSDINDAVNAYKEKAREVFGEFSVLEQALEQAS